MTDEERRLNEEENLYLEAQLSEIDPEDVVLTPAILPYSHWRIKQVFLENGYELRPYYTWYKAMRYRDHQNYVIVNMRTNEVFGDERGYSLYELQVYLSSMHVPLHGDNYKPPTVTKSGRRIACDKFLEAVEAAESAKQGGQSNG